MTATAKVFMSGRSQAVRLPKEFRFDVDEVQIERTKDGILLRTKTKLELFREYVARPSNLGEDFVVDRSVGLNDDSNRPIPFSDWTDADWTALDERRAVKVTTKSSARKTAKVAKK
jgi:antitoxin VapB